MKVVNEIKIPITTRIKLFLFAFVVLNLNFYAQNQPQLKWGNLQQNNVEGSDHVWIAVEDSNHIYVVKRSIGFKAKVFLYLECVDKNTKSVLFTKELTEARNERNQSMHFDDLVLIDSDLFLLSSLFEKDNQNRFSCYATPIDKLTGTYGKAYLVYRTIISKTDNPSFNYCSSPDAKKLLIIPTPYDSETNSFKIINKHLSGVLESSININDPLFLREFSAICDDSNNVCLYTYNKIYAPLKYGNQIVEFENGNLILYHAKTDSSTTVKVKTPNKTNIYDSKLQYANHKIYFLAALHPFYINRTAGMLSAVIDLEKQTILETNTAYLNKDQLDEISGINRGWKDSLGVFLMKDIFINKQNEIFLITEQNFHFREFFTRNGYNEYLMNGIFAITPVTIFGSYYISVFKLKQDCSVDWVKMIPKAQSHVVSQYLSYSTIFKNDKLFILYNDYLRNYGRKLFYGPATMTNQKKAIGVLTTVNGDGSLSTKSIYFPKTNGKLILKPLISSSRYNTLFVLGSKNDLFKWATLDIPLQD